MGGLPKARVILKADAALSAALGLLLLLAPAGMLAALDLPAPVPGLWTHLCGVMLLGFAVALAQAAPAGPAAARVVCGAAAVVNLASVAVIFAALGSETLGIGFLGAGLLALLAVVRLGFGALEAVYWGRLKGAAGR